MSAVVVIARADVPFEVYPSANAACAAVRARETRAHIASTSWAPARHAAGRFGFGANFFGTRPRFDADAWWSSQVSWGRAHGGYSAVPGLTKALESLVLDVPQTTAWLKARAGNAFSYLAMTQLTSATLTLQAFSPAQLYESVVDFFANHLNVTNGILSGVACRTTYDRATIRTHAFGNFRDMLQVSARDVAMQRYLTLSESTGQELNENYGRELLELHTVTPAAGYTQAEVISSSRIMTGRFHDMDYRYKYAPFRHWVGPVKVLGFKDANGSQQGGEAMSDRYLAYLASHPMTAQNLAHKLCLRFVSDTPSTALVNAVARAYLAHDTAILPTLSVIFRSTEFWASHGAKLRRPAENVIATVRALGLRASSDLAATGAALSSMCAAAGQVPLSWGPPDGFPDLSSAWRSAGTTASLWEIQRSLASRGWSSAFADWTPTSMFGSAHPATTGAALDLLAHNILGATLTSAQRSALLSYLGERSATPIRSSKAGTTELGNLAALMLHAPQHAVR